jgi:low affinity Fe/Cu permease
MNFPRTQHQISRVLHWIGDLTSKAGVAAVVASVVVLYLVFLVIAGAPGHWETTFQTVVGAVTLVMLFVIQHTQSRQQKATQLKLDELILATPKADDLLVKIENAKEGELLEREKEHVDKHASLREGEEAESK